MRSLIKRAKIVGELESPCRTPDDTGNQSVNIPLSFTHADVSESIVGQEH